MGLAQRASIAHRAPTLRGMTKAKASSDRTASAKPARPDAASVSTWRWPERTPGVRWLELLALLALLVALFVWWFDWNMLKPFVERRVEAQTGREFHIDGDLDVDLSMAPKITF